MRNEEISRLIEKFYAGETSEADERCLRAIFSGDQVPEGFETEKEIILFFMAKGVLEGTPSNLEERILKRVDESGRKSLSSKYGKYFLPLISTAAAVFMLLLGTHFFLESRSRYNDTFSDPELAYAETMKILMDVSLRLNKGTKTLEPVGKLSAMTDMSIEKISESSALINKSMSKLNSLGLTNDNKSINVKGIKNK
jgi:hypothetical protein